MLDRQKSSPENKKSQENYSEFDLRTKKIAVNIKTRSAVISALGTPEKKFFEKNGYVPNSSDNPNVEVVFTEKYGRAVFATDHIKKGEIIAEFQGDKYLVKKETDLPDVMVDHTIQVGEEEHIHGYLGLAEIANHACGSASNCGITDYTKVTALRDISPGEEIRWDYRRSEDSDWYLDGECKCGAHDCTKVVGPFRTLPEDMKNDYLNDGFTSDWIVNRYKNEK